MNTHDTATGRTVIDILTADHRDMIELLGQITRSSDSRARRDLADTLIAEVVRHAVAEEMYVYPAVQERLPDGAGMVAHDKEEHQAIVEVMKQIEDLDASDQAFMRRVRELEVQLRHHATDEESDQFPQLRAHLGADELIRWARRFRRRRRWHPPARIPTHPTRSSSTRRSDPVWA